MKNALIYANEMWSAATKAAKNASEPVAAPVCEEWSKLQKMRYDYLENHHITYRTLEMVAITGGVFLLSRGMIKRFRNAGVVGIAGGCIWTPELVNPFNRV